MTDPAQAATILLKLYPDYLGNIERVIEMLPQPVERIALFGRYIARQRALAAEGKQRPAYPTALPEPPSQPHA